jgi:hypothetical protein
MSTIQILLAIIGAFGALIAGMAALIKTMLFGKLADLKHSQDRMTIVQTFHAGEISALRTDVAKIHARHEYEDRNYNSVRATNG